MKPSRAMITCELSWAWIALSFAWVGSGLWPFAHSHLHMVLGQKDWNTEWYVLVDVPALLLFATSAYEYIAFRWPSADFTKRWTLPDYERSAKWRGRFDFALAFSWVYVTYVLLHTSARPSAFAPVAVGGICFSLWCWAENRRVQRDCRKESARFHAAT